MDAVSLLSLLVLATNIAFALLVFIFALKFVFKPAGSWWEGLRKKLTANALPFAFVITLTATLGSLYFSEVRGFAPCKLCWFQRIFMYPLPFIFGVALWKKGKEAFRYALPLAIVGLLIAAYHYKLQLSPDTLVPCSTVGFSVSCSQRFVTHFGYITIPWMSLSGFSLVTALGLLKKGKFS